MRPYDLEELEYAANLIHRPEQKRRPVEYVDCAHCSKQVSKRNAVKEYLPEHLPNRSQPMYCSSECFINHTEQIARDKEERNRTNARNRARRLSASSRAVRR